MEAKKFTKEDILMLYVKELHKYLSQSEIDRAVGNLQKEVENVWKNDRN